MVNLFHLSIIFLSVIVLVAADILIKKIAVAQNFLAGLKNPWLLIILILYFTQILLLIYIFSRNWKLGIVANLQIIFYSILMLLSGYLFFKETISPIQAIGIAIALGGIILINL